MPNRRNYVRHTDATVIRGAAVGPTVYDYFPPMPAISLGTVQLICGVALIILSIAVMLKGLTILFNGFDVAVWAILAGSFAVAAGKSKTACKVATNLVLSVLAAISSCTVFVMTLYVINQLRQLNEYDNTNESMVMERTYDSNTLAIAVTMTVVSAIEAFVAIASSVVSCHFVCLCCKNCCCEFDTTKTQQLLLANDDCSPELTQVLTVPVAVNVGWSSVNGNVPQAFASIAAVANDNPPPGYKQVVAETY